MKKQILIIPLCFIFSCGQSNQENKSDNLQDSVIANEKGVVAETDQNQEVKLKDDFFIISISGSPDLKVAVDQVKTLKEKGHPSGYLWMPDYPSLNAKDLYSVFIGPFSNMDTTIKYLEYYNKNNPLAYAVKVSQKKERITIHNKFDIRVNDKRQFLILTYSTPEDEEQYAQDGGEDWGWFTHDVSEYFRKHYPDKVIFSSVFYSWLTPFDIKQLERELGLEGFGYVLVNGKNKMFVPHDMPEGVIQAACGFFDLKYFDFNN